MTAKKCIRISTGITYFLWILFYVHLQIHKAQAKGHHKIIFADQDFDSAKKEADTNLLYKESDFYNIKNNEPKLQSIKTSQIKPRKSRDLNRSYRPYNDFPIFPPILLTQYIQRNPLENLFNVDNGENPSTKFTIHPSVAEKGVKSTQDNGLEVQISTTEPVLSPAAPKSLDDDSTITVRDKDIPSKDIRLNDRPNAFFLSDEDFVVDGNTTLQALAVPYTKTDDTLNKELVKSSIASDIIISTIIPTAELQLLSTSSSSWVSSNLDNLMSSPIDFASNAITISGSLIKPSKTEFLESSTVLIDSVSALISPSYVSSETSSKINVEASNVIIQYSTNIISSSWNSFTSEISNLDSKYSSLNTLEHSEIITVSHTATFDNETKSTTQYIMSRNPNDKEPDIITAPPFGSEVKTINVSAGIGLGSKFPYKGEVLNAEVDSNSPGTNATNLINSKSDHPFSDKHKPDDAIEKFPLDITNLSKTTLPPPVTNWNNNPYTFNDPVADDYSIETKNDGPILETCTIGDDSSCDAKLNEVCRKEDGISNCGCRLGSIRRKSNDVCRRAREFAAHFTVAKDGNTELKYGQDFLPSGHLFIRTKSNLEKAITNIFRVSEFRQYIISTKVNSFVPADDNRLVANTTIVFDSAAMFDLADLLKRLKRTLKSSFSNNNNRIGKSSLFTKEEAEVIVDDIDECQHQDLNDCNKFAICENSIGSFSCECKKGYKDPDVGSPDNKGRKCGGACSNDYCNNHGECNLVDVNVQSCKCHGSWSGEKCSIDGQVVGVAVGSSVVAFLIIIATLICLLRWSRRSKTKAAATRTVSASTPSNTFTYMKTPQYHMVGPPTEKAPERPPPLIRIGPDNQYSMDKPRWPEDPFEPFRLEQPSIYNNLEDKERQEDMKPFRVPKRMSPYKENVFPVSEEDLSQYFGSKFNLIETVQKQ